MNDLYHFLQKQLPLFYDTKEVIKSTPEKSIALLRHQQTGRQYILRRFQGSSACYLKLAGIHSPYLPEILETAEEDGQVIVLEEYIQGDSLYHLIQGCTLTPKQTKKIVLDVCKALSILHQRDIIHRDVKPENILLRGETAVLLDFDAARFSDQAKEKDTRVLGTSGYAAPEQFGLSQTDCRADIYALGVTMNLMLTGTHPSVRLADGRFGRIISKCTMMQPDHRYPNVYTLMEALLR